MIALEIVDLDVADRRDPAPGIPKDHHQDLFAQVLGGLHHLAELVVNYYLERVKYLEAFVKTVWTLKCPECGSEVETIGK
jgi:hypothetical protein